MDAAKSDCAGLATNAAASMNRRDMGLAGTLANEIMSLEEEIIPQAPTEMRWQTLS